MLLLGLSDSHDASVSLIEDGRILAAVSEERFTRKKRQQGFPYRSLQYAKEFIRGRPVERVYVAGKYGRALFRVFDFIYYKSNPQKDVFSFSSRIAYWIENIVASLPALRSLESALSLYVIKKRLKTAGIRYSSVELSDHHYSHLISSLSGMPSDNYLAVSLDAYGDGKSGLVIYAQNKKIIRIKKVSYRDSIAHLYGYICAYLGFGEGEEGKVMALAGFGGNNELVRVFRKLFNISMAGIKISAKYKSRSFLRLLDDYQKQDIAYALQKTVEEAVFSFIQSCLPQDKRPDLFLSGGFFANVKVNQRLHETKLFDRIFVFPNMGDGGTSFIPFCHDVSAADIKRSARDLEKMKFAGLRDVYLGPEYGDGYIKRVLKAAGVFYSQEPCIESKIAGLLAEGKTMARFNGRLEYGPRALGNRSILHQATDKTVNDWLNKKLKRNEFMPFAPVTLFDFKDMCYININGIENALKFMTISVDCTDWMKKVSPGVVHIDGTARPQLIKEEDNLSYYRILKEYHILTGIPSLINTSFNMHGEPICCSPEEAIRTFREAKLDYLAIGRFLVW